MWNFTTFYCPRLALTVLFEFQLSFALFTIALSSPPVFSSLSCGGHSGQTTKIENELIFFFLPINSNAAPTIPLPTVHNIPFGFGIFATLYLLLPRLLCFAQFGKQVFVRCENRCRVVYGTWYDITVELKQVVIARFIIISGGVTTS